MREGVINLNETYNKILMGEVVTIDFFSKSEYDSIRTNLLHKFRKSLERMEALGSDVYAGKYLKCSWNGKTSSGTFQLCDDARKKHDGKAKVYSVTVL